MRRIISFLLVAAALVAAPRLAQAHAMLDRASPAAGSTVAAAPKEVVLWFTEKLEPAFSRIEVRGADGAAVSAGKAQSARPTARSCGCR